MWFILRRKRKPNGSHVAQSDDGLRNGSHSRGSDDRIPNGSHLAGSYDGHTDGSDATSAMLVARDSNIELSSEGKSIHELQSLALPLGYQRHQYPASGSPDMRPPTHVPYELP